MTTRVPQLNPRTVKMARDFAQHQAVVFVLLAQLGWKGDRFKMHERLMELKMTRAPGLEKYLKTCVLLREMLPRDRCRMPKQAQYVETVLDGWKP